MIVATAGHVDHGKSTLVRLLTGTDPDRWDEEKRRGLTIDLGFAWMPGPDDQPASTIAFVDVPGHRRFLANMLAGCGAVDLGLLVVSAREGWMPQTEEHTQILDLLDVRRGLVALTHADLVEPTALRAAEREITAQLRGTALEGSPIIATAPDDTDSIAALRVALRDAAAQAPATTTEDGGRPRLWIDRSFRLRGTGRVVTGTLTGGSIAVGDEVAVVGGQGRTAATIRGLHVHGAPTDRAEPGTRVGVALFRLDTDPTRGDALVLPDQWTGGRRWQVALETVRDHPEPLAPHGGYHVFVGTAHTPAQLRFGDTGGDEASEHPDLPRLGRLHLRTPLAPVAIGDRFVLRDEGTDRTVAGGVILAVDTQPRRYAPSQLAARWRVLAETDGDRAGRAGRLAALLVEQAGGALPADALEAEVGPLVGTVGGPLRVVGPDVVHEGLTERRRAELLDLVRRSGGAPEPHDPLGRIAADRLVADGAVERLAGLLRPGGSATEERRLATGRIADALDSAVPPLLTPEELRSTIGAAASHRSSAIRAGELVEVGPFLTTRASFEGLAAEVEAAIGDGATTVSAIRERIGLTRKYVLPLLETLDRRGLTARLGDERRWIAS